MPPGSAIEVFFVFLRLGCTSFGGPIAHLGYFKNELVDRRGWCSPATFAEIVAVAQTLPGPASSQTGFALGLLRAGWLGGLAAWVGFTLPSALLMLGFAYGGSHLNNAAGTSLLHGLQLVAVAVVAQAVLSMQRSLAPDRLRLALAAIAAAIALFAPTYFATLLTIAFGAAAGLLLYRGTPTTPDAYAPATSSLSKFLCGFPSNFASRRTGFTAAAAFFLLLLIPSLLSHFTASHALAVFNAFCRTGALVFGGGHVVLPLLQDAVVARGWVTAQAFLAGYGAAQALPGPLFTFAMYLGAAIRPSSSPVLYGLLALLGIFLPGLLAMAAVLPFWSGLRSRPNMQACLRGINASVVGILFAALYRPLWTTTIRSPLDLFAAAALFALLVFAKVRPWIVVAATALLFTLPALF